MCEKKINKLQSINAYPLFVQFKMIQFIIHLCIGMILKLDAFFSIKNMWRQIR